MNPIDAPPPDSVEREAVLDPARSFIVQAPAGSGKTELLIRRILKVLPTLDAPEELLAITFTRKAAAEMRQRLFDALESARSQAASQASPDAMQRRRLASAVLEHDRRKDWRLLDNPSRLQVHTIDAFCGRLCRRMPLAGGANAARGGTEETSALYREAARRTLRMLAEGPQWLAPLRHLMSHLDNDLGSAESLLVGMLQSRELWLRHVAAASSPRLERETLEAALRGMIEDHLARVVESFPAQLAPELVSLARYAGNSLSAAGQQGGVASLAQLHGFPGQRAEDLGRWLALSDFLLTGGGTVRSAKPLGVKEGFPINDAGLAGTVAREMKRRMTDLLEAVAARGEFVEVLAAVRELPPPAYGEAQWQALASQLQVLPWLAAQLMVVFVEHGQVDHAAVMRAAIDALGTEDEPTDLGLSLDHRIRHILVDEFQDTSHGQFQLLERLTAGWEAGDGRTLFLVGDPMQSIYRFREADVGLYVRARDHGVGGLRLQPVTLRANFRAHAGLVTWINEHFARALPRTDDMDTGAIAYSPCVAVLPAIPGAAVGVRVITQGGLRAEAQETARILEQVRREHPDGSVAVLVAGRRQLVEVLVALRESAIPVSAVEIERLASRPVVRDLHALTRALLHPADRLAWLSVLRAPWCGLRLADLEIVARTEVAGGDTVPQALARGSWRQDTSADGRIRLERVMGILLDSLANRDRGSARRLVEDTWLALGGPATAGSEQDLCDAEAYLALLGSVESAEGWIDTGQLQERMDKLYAQALPAAPGTVQVMTIHGAKGLEFDTVVVPGLGSRRPNSDSRLLCWLERARPGGGADLLLAPVGRRLPEEDGVYRALSRVERRRDENERDRLLYVAATRARRALHLLGVVRPNSKTGELAPVAGSLLSRLWPALGGVFQETPEGVPAAAPRPPCDYALGRLPLAWRPPPPLPAVGMNLTAASSPSSQEIEFSWASRTARLVGVVVHGVLQRLAGVVPLPTQRDLEGMSAYLRARLRSVGVAESALEGALGSTRQALRAVLGDTRGRWLLEPHAEAACEWRMTASIDNRLVSIAIDRTFVDVQGVRWVIDYKTGGHEGAGREAFLDSEQARYREQLERYARVLRLAGETRPIRLALYFPLLPGWREWASV